MERDLTAKLKQLYGRELVGMITVARAQLYTSLATTAIYISPPIAGYAQYIIYMYVHVLYVLNDFLC